MTPTPTSIFQSSIKVLANSFRQLVRVSEKMLPSILRLAKQLLDTKLAAIENVNEARFRRCLSFNTYLCMPQSTNIEMSSSIRGQPIVFTINNAEFKSIFTENLVDLINVFKKYNYEIRVAGGAVRDLLLNKRPTDIDFATTATPNQMKEMFLQEGIRMINTNGEKHGTITPRINDKENFEITTLRIDVSTDGRHAEVQFTTNWQLDANRRDLTINSMFLGFDGNVYDYFNGYEDLINRRVKFVGEPDQRIKEDYLRILRYFRFCGKIADNPCNHELSTLEAIKHNINGLEKISGERIWSEIKKILLGKFGSQLMVDLIDCGAAKYIGFPENIDIAEFKHACNVCDINGGSLRPISLVTSFLKNQEGVLKLHQRLKLSATERDLAIFLTKNKETTKCIDDIRFYQKMCLQSGNNTKVIKEYIIELLKFHDKIKLCTEFSKWSIPVFPITGEHMLANNVQRGKTMGLAIQKLKEIWCDSEFQMSSADLLKHLPKILEELSNNEKIDKYTKRPKLV